MRENSGSSTESLDTPSKTFRENFPRCEIHRLEGGCRKKWVPEILSLQPNILTFNDPFYPLKIKKTVYLSLIRSVNIYFAKKCEHGIIVEYSSIWEKKSSKKRSEFVIRLHTLDDQQKWLKLLENVLETRKEQNSPFIPYIEEAEAKKKLQELQQQLDHRKYMILCIHLSEWAKKALYNNKRLAMNQFLVLFRDHQRSQISSYLTELDLKRRTKRGMASMFVIFKCKLVQYWDEFVANIKIASLQRQMHLQNDAVSLMIAEECTVYAQRLLTYRRQLFSDKINNVLLKVKGNALHSLQNQCLKEKYRKVMKSRALSSVSFFVDVKVKVLCGISLHHWNAIARNYMLRQKVLRNMITAVQRKQQSSAFYKIGRMVAVSQSNKMLKIVQLRNTFIILSNNMKSSAFRQLCAYASSKLILEYRRICYNWKRINATMTEPLAAVPLHNGIIMLTFTVLTNIHKAMYIALSKLYTNGLFRYIKENEDEKSEFFKICKLVAAVAIPYQRQSFEDWKRMAKYLSVHLGFPSKIISSPLNAPGRYTAEVLKQMAQQVWIQHQVFEKNASTLSNLSSRVSNSQEDTTSTYKDLKKPIVGETQGGKIKLLTVPHASASRIGNDAHHGIVAPPYSCYKSNGETPVSVPTARSMWPFPSFLSIRLESPRWMKKTAEKGPSKPFSKTDPQLSNIERIREEKEVQQIQQPPQRYPWNRAQVNIPRSSSSALQAETSYSCCPTMISVLDPPPTYPFQNNGG